MLQMLMSVILNAFEIAEIKEVAFFQLRIPVGRSETET
jgi:hypothetical protein